MRKISRSIINGRVGAGTGGQGLKVEWDSDNAGQRIDGQLHWMDISESSLEAIVYPSWTGSRGIIAGGNIAIDYITIRTTGNASDFGDMTQNFGTIGACSNGTRGVFGGGHTDVPDAYSNVMEYITIATTGNSIDFGDRTEAKNYVAGCSNGTRGIFGGGDYPATNVIDYITIDTTGNASDFGDLTVARNSHDAFSGSTRGVFGSGHTGSAYVDTIDYITIASTGNASDFGNTLQAATSVCFSSEVRGIIVAPDVGNQIQYVTTATLGNSTIFGALTVARSNGAGMSDGTYGVIAGATGGTNVIDYITIDTTGDATDFGDLNVARSACKGFTGS